MTPFEFVFALFGLLLGLSIAEMLGGLARSIKLHDKVRIGWLTPLLAVEILINLTTFWFESWRLRDQGAPTLGNLLLTLGALFLTIFGEFALHPMIEAAKAGQATLLSFGALHGVSATLYWFKAVLVAILAWRLTGPR